MTGSDHLGITTRQRSTASNSLSMPTIASASATGFPNRIGQHTAKGQRKRPYKCRVCQRSYIFVGAFRNHMKMHTLGRPHACDQCPMTFKMQKDLRRHFLIHSGARKFRCGICNLMHQRKDNLGRHIRRVHKQTIETAKQLAQEAEAEAKILSSVTFNFVEEYISRKTKDSVTDRQPNKEVVSQVFPNVADACVVDPDDLTRNENILVTTIDDSSSGENIQIQLSTDVVETGVLADSCLVDTVTKEVVVLTTNSSEERQNLVSPNFEMEVLDGARGVDTDETVSNEDVFVTTEECTSSCEETQTQVPPNFETRVIAQAGVVDNDTNVSMDENVVGTINDISSSSVEMFEMEPLEKILADILAKVSISDSKHDDDDEPLRKINILKMYKTENQDNSEETESDDFEDFFIIPKTNKDSFPKSDLESFEMEKDEITEKEFKLLELQSSMKKKNCHEFVFEQYEYF